jgi:hypothetical protein
LPPARDHLFGSGCMMLARGGGGVLPTNVVDNAARRPPPKWVSSQLRSKARNFPGSNAARIDLSITVLHSVFRSADSRPYVALSLDCVGPQQNSHTDNFVVVGVRPSVPGLVLVGSFQMNVTTTRGALSGPPRSSRAAGAAAPRRRIACTACTACIACAQHPQVRGLIAGKT